MSGTAWLLVAEQSNGRMLNAFQYSLGDPIRMVDFTGLAPKDKLFSLPKKFWNWYHRKVKKIGDPDLDKEEAKELFEH